MSPPVRVVQLLVVDDDEVDRELIVRGLRKAKILNPVVTAIDGADALELMRGTDTTPPLERPYVVVLDWNMPRMNGLEFLDALRSDPNLRDVVVFVLTTSDDQTDVARAYEHLVAGYIVKDRAGHDFMKLIEMLDAYWRIVELPAGGSA